jgi:hypothetical protein
MMCSDSTFPDSYFVQPFIVLLVSDHNKLAIESQTIPAPMTLKSKVMATPSMEPSRFAKDLLDESCHAVYPLAARTHCAHKPLSHLVPQDG